MVLTKEFDDKNDVEFVKSFLEIQKRIKDWSDAFLHANSVALNVASMTAHWYYSPIYDTFGPSKFVGYKNIVLGEYESNGLDGRDTEQAIKQLNEYTILTDAHPDFSIYNKKLQDFLISQGKTQKANAKIHITDNLDIRRLMFKLNQRGEIFSYKYVMLNALFNNAQDSSKSTHEYFWEFYRDRKKKNLPPDKTDSGIADVDLDEFKRNEIGQILDAPFDAINNCATDQPIIIKDNPEYRFNQDIIAELEDHDHKQELIDFVNFKLDQYFRNGFDMRWRDLISTFAEQFKADTAITVQRSLPYFQTLCVDSVKLIENILKQQNLRNQNTLVTASVGQGNKTSYPWLAVLDTRITNSVLRGYYIVYLFSDDMSELYLTFNQGSTKQKENKIIQNREKVFSVIQSIPGFQEGELPSGALVKRKSGSAAKNGKAYEQTNMFFKKYNISSLPNEDELVADLGQAVKAYEKVILSENSDDHSETFYEYLQSKNFYFDQRSVRNFVLSLKTKPFVILTGNSGTGKTKIAQLFAEYLSPKKVIQKEIIPDNDESGTYFKVGKATLKYGVTLPVDSLDYFDIPRIGEPTEILIEFDGNSEKEYFASFGYPDNREKLSSSTIRFRKKLKKFVNQHFVIGDFLRLVKIGIRKLKLEKISPETEVVHGRLNNCALVPVGANWTDKRHLLGFYNVITQQYQNSPGLDLILEAYKEENRQYPFFLILDEMNLSHVERYFADFLSVMCKGRSKSEACGGRKL